MIEDFLIIFGYTKCPPQSYDSGPITAGPPGPITAGPPGPITAGPRGPVTAGSPGPITAGPPGPITAGPPGPITAYPDLSIVKKQSVSRSNFAKNQLGTIVSEDEWICSNVSGTRGKKAIILDLVQYVKM